MESELIYSLLNPRILQKIILRLEIKQKFIEGVTVLDKYVVSGGKPLCGEVTISGAKNARRYSIGRHLQN